ncbi:hypothetical protein [Moraxella marmotae]|uniref:hypothetical protein n=1 Tax=Moraxella marmotae TaxID=3344520 RepID=UPI0035D4106A
MKISAILSLSLSALVLAACSAVPTTAPSTPAKTAPAAAQTPTTTPTVITSNDVDTVMNAFIVRMVDGQEVLEPVTTDTVIKSGDLIEYQTLLTNNGKDRVRNMLVALSLPKGASFNGHVSPSLGTQASVSDGRFVFMPLRTTVNGVVQNVPFSQYQALRWNIEDLGIGATAVVKYRATIN